MTRPTGPNPYLRTKILTSSPGELRLMLYDGAIKFCRQARAAHQKREIEPAYDNLMRAQKIVLELSSSLNRQTDPVLCEKLSALYTYIYRLLVDANIERRPEPIDEAVKLLGYERETWAMLMARESEAAGKADPSGIVGAQQTAMSTYSQSA